ncbi:DUF192 domain-containing protein [Thiosulfatihalobacter marinus]|jgi:hypothetical protein|uniref:DUF192 domain-containing protein n=1 Tax=Thiosulfatihalobacter marinus TaxID=2792481 RepID=UPI0018D65DCE|nr:DUF192 domain-containing protein [Thiosulfatihalobacter marinus]
MGKRGIAGIGQARRALALLALTIWALSAGLVRAETCAPGALFIRGDWGQARFSVEVADTEAERARGLMNRPSMASSAGMLFVYQRTGRVAFWMRNTLIPLDMLFADERGVVTRIHSNAIPLDETPIPGGDAIRYVVEINGGLARAMGITEGSQLHHPALEQDRAAWPC